jgi:DNA-binding CsgD family transcriptional regulator
MLLDRRDERGHIDRVLAATREGLSGVLVLRGEPGIGKTALLDYAVQAAADLRVVRLAGIESEMELSFAALHQVLLPFLDGLDQLPAPQRAALGSAFGLRDGGLPDRLLVGLASLSVLAAAAADTPLLCVVDDAQWLDRESAAVLAFVARRLLADRVAMIFAVREPSGRPVSLDGLPDVQLRGLPAVEAQELLSSAAGGAVDGQVAARIIAQTDGNPLGLIELGGELSSGELDGQVPLPDPLPLGRHLEARFLGQVRRLPADTQLLLLLVAADATGDAELLWRAADHLGLHADAATAAEEQGLLVFRTPVQFRHPLIRSALYHGAPVQDRRRVHAALAEATDPVIDGDRRAWHRAAATAGRDEAVAAELERAAGRAGRRGGYAAAGAFLARAAALTPDTRQRVRRLLAAAQDECTAGNPGKARELLQEAAADLDGPYERGLAKRVEGAICLAADQPAEAAPILLAAADELADVDGGVARDALMEALTAAGITRRFSAPGADARAVARAVRALPVGTGASPAARDALLDAYAAYLLDGPGAAASLIQHALAALDQDEATGPVPFSYLRIACWMVGATWDDNRAHAIACRGVEQARRQGAMTPLAMLLVLLGESCLLTGEIGAARDAFVERREIKSAAADFCRTGEAVVLAWQGEERAARSLAAVVTEDATRRQQGWRVVWVEYALSVLELGLGHYRAALDALDGVRHDYEENPVLAALAWSDRIEAAVRCDETQLASEILDRLEQRAGGSTAGPALGLLTRSRALLAADHDAERLYRQAIDQLSGSRGPAHRARACLLYGEWLRRENRVSEARRQLQLAWELFTEIGAGAFAERARRELAATGASASRSAAERPSQLTPQEETVARLAAAGATNTEIAAELFISPSTVDYHLRKVFRKFGIASRRQLHRMQLEGV